MFDRHIRPFIDPPLVRIAMMLSKTRLTPNGLTIIGMGFGIACGISIGFGWPIMISFALLVLSRLADGLDGAVARATRKTDFGGYLDITCDFLFYGAVPMAFVWVDPAANAAAGAWLLTSFYFNGATFLAYAILA